eukprot:CAMPEP_0179077534 /NCGR_PEP_ID=MMETSP0796-20121207/34663_1 /TAXON_ID=73915 /ORGANISM="Pyrodinium bahamense, Strain pbaha01" /LENGTH=209 /DNA_ID=CAMNT_0020774815 /DNA_START=8 /DNA_END=637 /DNA_ORIENTATION=-
MVASRQGAATAAPSAPLPVQVSCAGLGRTRWSTLTSTGASGILLCRFSSSVVTQQATLIFAVRSFCALPGLEPEGVQKALSRRARCRLRLLLRDQGIPGRGGTRGATGLCGRAGGAGSRGVQAASAARPWAVDVGRSRAHAAELHGYRLQEQGSGHPEGTQTAVEATQAGGRKAPPVLAAEEDPGHMRICLFVLASSKVPGWDYRSLGR